MKTRINLGIAFTDAQKLRRLSFQLIPVGQRHAVATADFQNGSLVRLLTARKCSPVAAGAFLHMARELSGDDVAKSLEWSFAGSPNAEAWGKPAGCWTVQLRAHERQGVAVRAFDSKEQALDTLRLLPFPLCPIWAKLNPTFSAA